MSPEELAAIALRYMADPASDDPALAANPEFKAELEDLRQTWRDLGHLPSPQPTPALRARFYQKLNGWPAANSASRPSWWKRGLALQIGAGLALFLLGLGIGRFRSLQPAPNEISELRNQVEGLRQTVALSLIDKQSASSRLQGVEWSSRIDRPDQELLNALLTTLNQDPNINVRLASLDALEKFTFDPSVRKALEKSITGQQSPLLQIALIDALVHIRDSSAGPQFKQLSNDRSLNTAVRQRAQWAIEKLSLE